MNSHHTKDKGDIGVLKVAADLAEKSYTVLFPQTEHAPFDLVVYRDNAFSRISVKYRRAKNGCFTINFRSCWADKHGVHMTPLDKSAIDYMAIYCPDTDEVYYLNPSAFKKSVTLRIDHQDSIRVNTHHAHAFKSL